MDPITLIILGTLIMTVVVAVVLIMRRGSGLRPLLPRIVAAGAVIGAILTIVGALVAMSALFSDWVTLTVPVIADIEVPPEDLLTGDARIISGSVVETGVTLTVSGLDVAAKVWLAIGQLLNAAVIATVLFVIARFAQQSIAAEPFAPRLHRLLIIAGAALVVGSGAAQAALAVAGEMARYQLFAVTLPDVTYAPAPVTVDLIPIGIGLTLIVIAGLIRSGERLQHETKGLV